jgi:predicted small secreted protein
MWVFMAPDIAGPRQGEKNFVAGAKTGEPSLPRMHLPQRDSFIIQRTVMNKSIAILLFGAVFILSACDPNTMTGASSGAKFQPIDSAPGGGRNAAIWENTSQYGGGTRH